jgi:hypothetical protein
MRQKHVIDCQRLPRASADVKNAVQLRYDDHGLLTGHAVPGQCEVTHRELGKTVRTQLHRDCLTSGVRILESRVTGVK